MGIRTRRVRILFFRHLTKFSIRDLIDLDRGDTMQQNYKMKEYAYHQLKGRVSLPKFQRSLVWDIERQEKFIRTALAGDPFGVLLIYLDPKTHEQQVIDGLQRFTTLQTFEKNPLAFVEFVVDDYPMIAEIVRHINQVFPHEDSSILSALKVMIKEAMETCGLGQHDEQSFRGALLEKIERMYPEITEHQAHHFIQYEIRALHERLIRNMSIEQLNIPVLIYQGDQVELPNIFERLNRGGTSLTKYEVFASTWSNTLVEGVDAQTAKIIEEHYIDKIEKTEMKIDNYNEGDILISRKVTLYEYCFALGKRIKKSAPLLFKKNRTNRIDSVDSIGFSTLASVLGMHLKEMATLNQYVHASVRHHRLQQLHEAILCVYEDLNDLFSRHVMDYSKYIEGQVISLAVTLFRLQYDFDRNTLEIERVHDRDHLIRSFRKYAPFRVFYDMIRNFWSGSGDNKLNEIRLAPLKENRYIGNLSDDLWRSTLIEWMSEQLTKSTRSMSGESKFFMSLITRPYVGDDDVKAYRFSHVIPKKILKEHGIDQGISHVGNMFFLPDRLKAYKNRVLAETFDDGTPSDLYHYPEKETLSFIGRPDAKNGYDDFLHDRIRYLADLFVESIKPV